MKAVILAGGRGTRLSPLTKVIPKPMVEVGGIPLLMHIIKTYAKHGVKDFCILTGYRGDIIHDYLMENWEWDGEIYGLDIIYTGIRTLTGGRLKRAQGGLTQPFFMTYGDGVSNVDISFLELIHKYNRRVWDALITVTAVRPPARFGSLKMGENQKVEAFHEKTQVSEGWINGGFMVIEPQVLDMIDGDDTNFEKDILTEVATMGRLRAYQHSDFWQCVDTTRDLELLNRLWKEGAPW